MGSRIVVRPCCWVLVLCVAAAPAAQAAREGVGNLLRDGRFALFQSMPGSATLTNIVADGTPGGHPTALRLAIAKSADPFYHLALSQDVPVAVREWTRLRLRFWARSGAGNPMRAVVEKAGPPWTSVAETSPTLTREWTEYRATGTARGRFAPGDMAVRFQVGHQTGDVELAGIALDDLGPDPAWTAARSALDPSAIQERIERHRTGELTVRAERADGTPVPKAGVTVEQTRHAFLFGCNLFGLEPDNTEAWQEAYRGEFAAVFNYATLPFYWGSFEPQQGRPQYARLDAMARWCAEHGITPKGHPLVWHEVYPTWAPKSADAAVPLLRQRVTDIVTHYRDSIRVWDVLNEANNAAVYAGQNGEAAWVKRDGAVAAVQAALGWARGSLQGDDAQFTLLYNDFNTGEQTLSLLTELMNRHALPDAIGIQSHMHAGAWPLEEAWQKAEEFSRFGRPLHFTELTVLSGPARAIDPAHHAPDDWRTTPDGEAEQADYVEGLYALLFSHPAVQAITWWDFSDRGSWMQAPAGLVRSDMTPKPAYGRLLRLIRRTWWTNAGAETDDDGICRMRAFYGDYRISATDAAGRTATSHVSFTMGSGSRTVTLTMP